MPLSALSYPRQTSHGTYVDAIEAVESARSVRLLAQVETGAHVDRTRAVLAALLRDVRLDANLRLACEPAVQRAFGVGVSIASTSASHVRQLGEALLEAARAHPEAGAILGLDLRGSQDLGEPLAALVLTVAACERAASERMDVVASPTDSLAGLVAAEIAHIRLIARRVFSGDDARLAPFEPAPRRTSVPPRGAQPPPS